MLFRKKSALTRALTRWLNDGNSGNGNSLVDLLPQGDAACVRTEAEARLACAAIDKARSLIGDSNDLQAGFDLASAIALMQQVDGDAALQTFVQQGLPRLRLLVRDRLANPKIEHALFALKVIGLYRQPEDVELFIAAARAPIEPDDYGWHPAFYGVTADNPCTPALLAGLASPLPTGFIRVTYLDKCNELAIAGHLPSHPFASPEGIAALGQWLSSTIEKEASYAVSACAALPFMPSPDRERLLALAASSPAAKLQIESAWARARVGMEAGVDALIGFARDARHSAQATTYLRELGHEGRIPAEVNEPGFVALAEMCQWLAHPNEMGRPPDEIEIAESRELYWPPTRDRRRLWIFRYLYRNPDAAPDEGYGMTGSITWAMFGSNTIDLSPEDVYGLHCAWELQQCEDREAPPESTSAAGRAILTKYNPTFGRPTLSVV